MIEKHKETGVKIKTAIFPGRFQPPHIGHILTIMRIYPDYDKILVAVVKDPYEKRVLSTEEVIKILRTIFKHLPKIEVIDGGLKFQYRSSFKDLPPFDVVVGGNKKTIQHLKKLGIKTRYVPRSGGYNSTAIRNAGLSEQWR